jgi:hypothetical protein
MRVKQRKRIFVGCEGDSERSYARWLQDLSNSMAPRFQLDPFIAGGGDPLAIVEACIRASKKRERERGLFWRRVIILDSDKLGENLDRDRRIDPASAAAGMTLLYQEWEHEAVLLRHFPRHQSRRPPAGQGLAALLRVWPEYRKPSDAITLGKKLSLSDLRRMMRVEPEFDTFCRSIGL